MEIALLIANLLLKYGPDVAQGVATIVHAPNDPALQLWLDVFNKVRTYDQIIAGK